MTFKKTQIKNALNKELSQMIEDFSIGEGVEFSIRKGSKHFKLVRIK